MLERKSRSAPTPWCLLCGRGVDQPAHGSDAIARKTLALGVLLDTGLVRSEINAVHFVAGDITVEPLNLRTHSLQHADGLLGKFAQLGVGQLSGSGNFAFDDEFGHERMLACE